MTHHYTFQHELDKLNKQLLKLSTMIEERVRRAAQVIETGDPEAIQEIIVSDYQIDEMEIEIEEDCLKILALHQPVARDLRFLIAVIKINSELERIGDYVVHIAKRVDNISKFKHPAAISYDFSAMSDKVVAMLKNSIDALVDGDADLAKTIFRDDEFVDTCRTRCYEDIKERIRKDPEHPGYHINTFLLARHLERIADRAVNIAEEVVYLVEGNITRFS